MQLSIAIETLRAVAAGKPDQLAALRIINAELEARQDRIDELSEDVGLKPALPRRLGLTDTQASIFNVLRQADGLVTTERLETLLYGALPECDRPRNARNTIKAHVCHMRRILELHGIEVESVFDRLHAAGYRLTPTMKLKAQALIDQLSRGDT